MPRLFLKCKNRKDTAWKTRTKCCVYSLIHMYVCTHVLEGWWDFSSMMKRIVYFLICTYVHTYLFKGSHALSSNVNTGKKLPGFLNWAKCCVHILFDMYVLIYLKAVWTFHPGRKVLFTFWYVCTYLSTWKLTVNTAKTQPGPWIKGKKRRHCLLSDMYVLPLSRNDDPFGFSGGIGGGML